MCHPNHLKRPATTTTPTSPPLPPSTSSSWQTSSSPRLTASRLVGVGQCGRWKRRSTAPPSGTSSSFLSKPFCRRTFATDQPTAIDPCVWWYGVIFFLKGGHEMDRYKDGKNIFWQLCARKHKKVVCSSWWKTFCIRFARVLIKYNKNFFLSCKPN